MTWFRKFVSALRRRPVQVFWCPPNETIVSVTPWRDMVVFATDRGVYVVQHQHDLVATADIHIQQVQVRS